MDNKWDKNEEKGMIFSELGGLGFEQVFKS